MQRRHFFSSLAAAMSGWSLFRTFPAAARNLRELKDDPRFWSFVREQFVFPPGYTYLNLSLIHI